MDQVGSVIANLVAGGVKDISGASFSVSEPTKFRDDAREKAFADAHRKAELYAKAAGAKLGNPLEIDETNPERGFQVAGEEEAVVQKQEVAPVPIAPRKVSIPRR